MLYLLTNNVHSWHFYYILFIYFFNIPFIYFYLVSFNLLFDPDVIIHLTRVGVAFFWIDLNGHEILQRNTSRIKAGVL